MSKGRVYYGIDEFSTINKELGIKPKKQKKNYDENKRKKQRIKFCKCPVCGNGMSFIKGTNTLVCYNKVTKEKTITQDDGTEIKKEVEDVCDNINIVDNKYLNYVNYLFDGVDGNIAVKEIAEQN